MDADRSFLGQYEAELVRIGDELTAIDDLLAEGRHNEAWVRYNSLRDSLLMSRRTLSDEISRMQKAQAHVHALLT